jgi:hypothetical protein
MALAAYRKEIEKQNINNHGFRDFIELATQPLSFQDLLDL